MWLKGGPLLELSFVLLNQYTDKEMAEFLIQGFEELEFKCNHQNTAELIQKYADGNFDQQENLNDHAIKLSFYYEIGGKRLCNVYIDKISSQLTKVDVRFYGDENNGHGQKGIKANEIKNFIDLFVDLYLYFKFPLGTVGYEVWCLYLFNTKKITPDKEYHLKNIVINNAPTNYLALIYNYEVIHSAISLNAINISEDSILWINTDKIKNYKRNFTKK